MRCAKPPPRLPHRALYDLVRAAGAPAGSGGKDPKDPKAVAAMPKVSALSRRIFLGNGHAAINALRSLRSMSVQAGSPPNCRLVGSVGHPLKLTRSPKRYPDGSVAHLHYPSGALQSGRTL